MSSINIIQVWNNIEVSNLPLKLSSTVKTILRYYLRGKVDFCLISLIHWSCYSPKRTIFGSNVTLTGILRVSHVSVLSLFKDLYWALIYTENSSGEFLPSYIFIVESLTLSPVSICLLLEGKRPKFRSAMQSLRILGITHVWQRIFWGRTTAPVPCT